MWTITFKGKPITLGELKDLCRRNCNLEDFDQYIAFRTRKRAIDNYIYYAGFTWEQRIEGIEVKRMVVRK